MNEDSLKDDSGIKQHQTIDAKTNVQPQFYQQQLDENKSPGVPPSAESEDLMQKQRSISHKSKSSLRYNGPPNDMMKSLP